MKDTEKLISDGCLQGYDIETKEGYNQTVHYTTRIFGKQNLQKLYGFSELPVIHNLMSNVKKNMAISILRVHPSLKCPKSLGI